MTVGLYLAESNTVSVLTVVAASVDVVELLIAAKHLKISSYHRFELNEIAVTDSTVNKIKCYYSLHMFRCVERRYLHGAYRI